MSPSRPQHVDILILGAGWTSTFLLPLLASSNISHAATTTTGRDNTIPFSFDPDSDALEPYRALPLATTILITFPLKGAEQPQRLVECYNRAHDLPIPHSTSSTPSSQLKSPSPPSPNWIQLGTTSIFTAPTWNTPSSPISTTNPRAAAETALLTLLPAHACILNLAGLYGGTRQPRNWLSRVARSLDDAKAKGALHLVHGTDVARAVVAAARKWDACKGRRWILTDCHVYDWWDVFWELGPTAGNGEEGGGTVEGVKWRDAVAGFMHEEGVQALPRGVERLGRVLDGRGFWAAVGVWPAVGREWATL